MDELYETTPAKGTINPFVEPEAPRDFYHDYAQLKKKMPKSQLHKQLNEVLTDDARRKAKILERIKAKKINL
jgi:hypothetical protein